MLGFNHFVAKK